MRRFLHADERGSIVAASDSAGNLAAGYSYDEYGTPAAANSGRFQYTGQMWLHEIGVQYSKARMYAPHLGRFLQPDPIRYAAGPNLYAYVGNDPVNFTDPLGLDGDETECPENQHRCPPAIIVTGSQPSGGGGAPTTNAANAALLTAGVSPVPAPSGPDITVIGRRPRNLLPPPPPTTQPVIFLMAATSAAPPPYDPKKNWCGGEGGANLPSGTWNAACYNHDLCYGKVGAVRSQCDTRFRNEVAISCPIAPLGTCGTLPISLLGWLIVRLGGRKYFNPSLWGRQ